MTTPIIDQLDPMLRGYVFWHDPTRTLPFRWAAASTPPGYDKRHGSHHGGATSEAGALVAAERHAMQVKGNAHLHATG